MTLDQTLTLAKQRHSAGELRQAEPLYRQVLAADPNHPEALNMLGLIALQCGQPQPAIELMERSVALSAGVFFFHNNLAEAYKAAGRYADAAAAFERSLAIRPGDVETTHSLGNALEKAGQPDRAIEVLRGVTATAPQFAKAHMSLGAILDHQGHYDEALGAYERAIALQPDYAKARAGRAGIWLRRGDYDRGWDEYDWRWRVEKFPGRPPRPGIPVWDGGDLAGRRILLVGEQGLGDTIQFIRYAPLVAARGGKVLVECPKPLVRLVRTVEGVTEVVAPEDAPPTYDVQFPLLSLPRLMRTRLDTVPSHVPYLGAPAEVGGMWRTKLADQSGGFKVGLCWAGGQSQPHRTMRAEQIARLAEAVPAARFFSLQKDRLASDPDAPPGVTDLMAEVSDFADTAGLVAQLDLVISIDTSVAHLAAAMGKLTWITLARLADWRWMEERAESPWYPTARLFRQERVGDWGGVIERVAAELQRMVAERVA